MARENLPLRPPDDDARVDGLRASKLLDSAPEERFDRLVRELAEALETPIAYLALIDSERQWLKSKIGEIATQVHRDHSFCNHTILGSEPMLIADASQDPRFSSSPLVADDPKLRSYAGMPIIDAGGHRVGTVCVADKKPRRFERDEILKLLEFAARIQREIQALPRVFVSYCREDEEWKDELVARCQVLDEHGLLDLWDKDRLTAEASGDGLRNAIERAKVAVLLLTEHYLESGLAVSSELATHLRRRLGEGLAVVPAVVGACDWQTIDWLGAVETWPPDARPIAAGGSARISADFEALASKIATTLKRESAPITTDEARPRAVELTRPARRLFLSHSAEDARVARELARRLRLAGLEVWLDEDVPEDQRWSEAVEGALEQADAFAVYVGRSGIERGVSRDVQAALLRNKRDPGFRILPLLGPGATPESLGRVLSLYQAVPLGDGVPEPDELQQLVGAVLETDAEDVALIPEGQAPFRGLLTFEVGHSHLFFGRKQETEELLERLESAPFLAVVGDSGSGKSSLVRAGLVPAVDRGPGSGGARSAEAWNVMILKPGDDPFGAVAAALVDLCPECDPATRLRTSNACAKQLAEGVDGLSGCIAGLVRAGTRTLVVVDQFEEIFTLVEDDDERRRFIDTLLRASTGSGDRPVHVVITLRADFLDECWSHTDLWQAIRVNEYSVSRMSREQLRDVIENPAVMAGARFEPGLTDAILADVGDEPGNLPLLEHALLELWERRSQRQLTHDAYKEIGRLQGALEHRAEEVFERLGDEEQKQAKRIYLNLVAAGARTEATRKRADLRDILPPEPGAGPARKVLDRLVSERLVITSRSGDAKEGEETVEVAHEALIREWKRFKGWLDENREFLLWRQRAKVLVNDWEAKERDEEALLGGRQLAEAERWLEERGDELHPDGRAFIEASIARDRRQKRSKRRRAAVVAGLAVVATLAAAFALWQWSKAQKSFDVAKMAMEKMGETAEVSAQVKADTPEMLGMKADIADKALNFYGDVREMGIFTEDLRVAEGVASYRRGNVLRVRMAEGAVASYDRAIEMLTEAGNDAELANAFYHRGWFRWTQGQLEEARQDYERAQDLQSPAPEDSARRLFELGRTLNGLGIVQRRQDLWEEAERSFKEARQRFEEATGIEERDEFRQGLAWSLTNLAELYDGWAEALADEESSEKRTLAEETYSTAIDTLEPLSERREIKLELATTLNNLANLLNKLERYEDALAKNQEALDHLQKLSAAIPEIRNELGNSYLTRGNALEGDEAEAEYLKARDIFRKLEEDGKEDPENARERHVQAIYNLVALGYPSAEAEFCALWERLRSEDLKGLDQKVKALGDWCAERS